MGRQANQILDIGKRLAHRFCACIGGFCVSVGSCNCITLNEQNDELRTNFSCRLYIVNMNISFHADDEF